MRRIFTVGFIRCKEKHLQEKCSHLEGVTQKILMGAVVLFSQ